MAPPDAPQASVPVVWSRAKDLVWLRPFGTGCPRAPGSARVFRAESGGCRGLRVYIQRCLRGHVGHELHGGTCLAHALTPVPSPCPQVLLLIALNILASPMPLSMVLYSSKKILMFTSRDIKDIHYMSWHNLRASFCIIMKIKCNQ